MFEAVILMGGFGTRLKDVSGKTPKPMVVVGNEPFVYLLMKKLEASGCSKIVLSLHYRARYIIEKISSDAPVNCPVVFVVEDEPLGTGGGIKLAAAQITSEYFIAINGDTYCEINYRDFYNQTDDFDLMIAGVHVDNIERYGSLDLDSQLGITALREKGALGAGYINCGTYLINRQMIMDFKSSKFSFEIEFIPQCDFPIRSYLVDSIFVDIGIPEDYFYACELLT